MPDTDRTCHHCEELLLTDHEYDQHYHDGCLEEGTPWNSEPLPDLYVHWINPFTGEHKSAPYSIQRKDAE